VHRGARAGMKTRLTARMADAVALAVALAAMPGCATGEVAAVDPHAAEPAPRSAPDDGDLLGVVPQGAETLLEVDVAQLRRSPWSAPLLATSDDERAARTATQGFDEVSDVDRALFAVSESGGQSAASGQPTTLTVAQGRFDAGRLARALGDGWAAGSWRGSRLWERPGQALALLTARTLLRGEPAAVRTAIDCAWGLAADARASPAGELRRELTAAGDHPALLAASVVTEAMRRRVESDVPLPASLERVGARLDLGAAFELEVFGLLATPAAANETVHNLQVTLRDLRARRALAAFGITPFLSSLVIAPQGRRARVHLTLAEERRDDLAARLAQVLEAIRARPFVPPGGK
jgi:hypothetical protein